MSAIDVTVEKNESGGMIISIKNNGKSIPTTIHKKEKIHIPELIFGTLLTGSNFDDTKVNDSYWIFVQLNLFLDFTSILDSISIPNNFFQEEFDHLVPLCP